MDAKVLREKAAICLQLAQGLSWNNPDRYELMNRAQDLQRRAGELETKRNSICSNRNDTVSRNGTTPERLSLIYCV
jgi:hypothetical protein